MDEHSQIDGKPFPKNSKIKEEDNEPRESMDNQNEQSQDNNINNDDNNFPEAPNNYNDNENENENQNDDFDKYNGENNNNNDNGENNENEEYNNDFNNDNNFKDDGNENNNNNDNKNNDGSVRFSNLTDNNRYSSANNGNDNQKNENENDFDFGNDNDNNNNNNYNNNDNFGFNESGMKENDNNFNDFNPNLNQNNDNFNNNNNDNDKNTNIRGSGNSEHLQMKENNNINKENNQDNKNNFNNKPNNSILRNRNNNNFNNNNNNNNFNNNNRNNNFNYASNPYSNNNNNNQNGGQNYNTNTTATQFIPQDNHVINNLNYNYSSNYGGGSNQVHHADYHSYYGRFEEMPEDTDGLHIDPQKKGGFSTTLAGIQIANQLMGAGLLSAPIIMSYLGLLVGIIFYIFMAIVTYYSVFILMRCHEITGKSGYSMLAKVTLGKVGNIIVKIILVIQGIGLCGVYLRIFGECLQTVFLAWISKDSYLVEDDQVYLFILFGGLIMIIFVAVKKISNLKRLIYLGIIIALVICISISILLFYKGVGDYLDSDISWDFLFPDSSFSEAFQSSATIFVAFLFHANAYPIYYSIKHRNTQEMMKATKIGISLSLVIFLIFGVIGLFLYGFDIDDSILENFYEDMGYYQDSNTFIIIMLIIICLFFVLLCLSSFPILFRTLQVNFVNSILICTKSFRRGSSEQDVQISQGSSHKPRNYLSKKVLGIITIILYVLVVVFAILIYRVQTFLTIVGTTAGIFLIFILPHLFYLLILKQTGKRHNIYIPIILVGFGVFFFFVTLITAFF